MIEKTQLSPTSNLVYKSPSDFFGESCCFLSSATHDTIFSRLFLNLLAPTGFPFLWYVCMYRPTHVGSVHIRICGDSDCTAHRRDTLSLGCNSSFTIYDIPFYSPIFFPPSSVGL